MDDYGYMRGLMAAVAGQTDYSRLQPAAAT